MATSLFKMPFDPERLKVQRIYQSPELSHCQVETMTCPKIQEIYGDLKFLELHEDRPCTYTSLVTSIDGRIAFTDAPQGPLIAKKNKYDPAGADTDWFILNMLRAVSDGVMLGAGTMNAEADYTCHVFDQDMEDMRIANGKNPVPWNIVTSLDATDIPFDHILFRSPEVPVMISTSRKGAALVKENLKNDAYFVDAPTLEDVTEELIQGMKENADKVLVIGTGDTAPDSKVALYVLKKFGIDRLLVETDSPYVLPDVPWTGSKKSLSRVRNSSLLLPRVVEEIARLKHLPPETAEAAILENTRRVFHLSGAENGG